MGSAPTISATAEAAREQARDDQGRFGVQPAAEADVDLGGLDVDPPDEEPDEPEGFDHGRISSLMGDAYHLDPERKVALPSPSTTRSRRCTTSWTATWPRPRTSPTWTTPRSRRWPAASTT